LTDKTAKLVQALVDKWAPPLKAKEFIKEVGELIIVAVNECTTFMLTGEGTPAPDPRQPPVFLRATCRGSFALNSACGHCERCDWELKKMGLRG
jgi:hypothetical protein